MQMTSIPGIPKSSSDVWQIQHHRRRECGFNDVSIKNGDVADVARHLPDAVRERLRTVDIRSFNPRVSGFEPRHLADQRLVDGALSLPPGQLMTPGGS